MSIESFLSLEGEDTGEGEDVGGLNVSGFSNAFSLTLALSRWEREFAAGVPIVC